MFVVAFAGGCSGVIIIGDQVLVIEHDGHGQVTSWDYVIGLQDCGVVIQDHMWHMLR